MSSCLSGGAGRTYGFDLDIVKSPSSPSSRSSSHSSSSPSSTLSESSNSAGLAISTKRARAPRKRPNQTYTEAAALLSTIYPNVFSANNLLKLYNRAARPHDDDSFPESSDLLPPFPPPLNDAGFLLLRQPVSEITDFRIESTKPVNSPETGIRIPPDSDFFRGPNSPCLEEEEDFDAESILDEEMVGGEGIDSIMGNLSVDTAAGEDSTPTPDHYYYYHSAHVSPYLGNHPMGFGLGGKFEFGFGFGFGCNMRAALRRADDGEWWRSPTVPVLNMAPKHKTSSSSDKKKKKKNKKKNKVEKVERKETKVENDDSKGDSEPSPSLEGNLRSGFSLKLNYEEVLKAWSDQGSPFSDAKDSTESHADAIAKLAQIELFPEEMGGSGGGGGGGGVREASVMRYKEKRRSRLFSKKIRYQVRKVNADTRPRMQGRFVRRPSLLR